uniref:Reverse transcriptase Ty1/copia-type domain-containing protein n=1 Tax=Solanum lycopersicum TaxID=4081 RepID=A0A3Q7I4E0_SOLLC
MAISSSTNGADTPFADITHFRSLIGALQYLAITCPDIQFAVNRVAQGMHQPSEHDYHCLKRILRYIFGTLGFSDSDWANDKNDRKSTLGSESASTATTSVVNNSSAPASTATTSAVDNSSAPPLTATTTPVDKRMELHCDDS